MKRAYLVLGLLIMLVAGLVPACGRGSSDQSTKVSVNAKEASLVDVWEGVVGQAKVKELTADLEDLSIWLSRDGSIELMSYSFCARDTEGNRRTYFVNSNCDGDVTYWSYDGVGALTGTSPAGVFADLDRVPAATILGGKARAWVEMGFESGTVNYEGAAAPSAGDPMGLYALDDGQLVPLKRVVFRSSGAWGTISIGRFADQEDSTSYVDNWFLASELAKAESVEYA